MSSRPSSSRMLFFLRLGGLLGALVGVSLLQCTVAKFRPLPAFAEGEGDVDGQGQCDEEKVDSQKYVAILTVRSEVLSARYAEHLAEEAAKSKSDCAAAHFQRGPPGR